MDKKIIKALIEEYLNYKRTSLPIDFESGTSSITKFELHTVKRLKNAFDLFKDDNQYLSDFMLALRNYLIIYKTDIELIAISLEENNDFAIIKDPQTGKYFASFQFPEYVNESFVKQAFLREFQITKSSKKSYELSTDPLIFSITGFPKFKSMAQKIAVYGALNTPEGYTTLVSLPTGGGKSLITQIFSYQKEGLTIIIVPTVSLAIDQVRVAKEIIHSDSVENEIFYYSSGVNITPILKAIKMKSARMLFISPEALINNLSFSDIIKDANLTRYLKNIIIDEAHIVVDWGASFRIDYQCLESWRKSLLMTNPSIRTILLSATFERRSIEILKDFFSHDEKWIEIRCDSLRHEPRYILVKAKSQHDKDIKMLELVHKLPHPMIIYVARPDDAERIKKTLQSNGFKNARTFTGLTPSSKRKELIDAWVDDQFEIMIATSAFGIGVDKSDVRTVLHMYIPQNPSAYYQELGRGGRDKIPCLSVMCIHQKDTNVSFQRVSKRVMTTEKIIGRWDSMYNNNQSIRINNFINIDTSIKPNYNIIDAFDDSPTSDADMNWNIYILLLLRRYNLIRIREVLSQNGKYTFIIEIVDETLRNNNVELLTLINKIRTIEWNYYNNAFHTMKNAISNSDQICWSEMFYETYDKVSEFCAGCNSHSESNEGDFLDFPLKTTVKTPMKELAEDQLVLFGRAKEVVIIANELQRNKLLDLLLDKRLSLLVTSSDINIQDYLAETKQKNNLLIIDKNILQEFIKKSAYYYTSGITAILYSGNPINVFEKLKLVSNYLSIQKGIRIIHILSENIYFKSQNKMFSDLIDGSVIPIDTLFFK